MGWKTINGHAYYYRSGRRNGRPVKTYYGRGEFAEAVALMDAIDRQAAEAGRRERREERERDLATHRELAGLVREAKALAKAALEEAGYHERKGEWRKRRVRPGDRAPDPGGTGEGDPGGGPAAPAAALSG